MHTDAIQESVSMEKESRQKNNDNKYQPLTVYQTYHCRLSQLYDAAANIHVESTFKATVQW